MRAEPERAEADGDGDILLGRRVLVQPGEQRGRGPVEQEHRRETRRRRGGGCGRRRRDRLRLLLMMRTHRRRRRCGPRLPLPRRRPRRHCLQGARSSSTRHPPLDPVALRGFLLGLFPLSGWVTHSWGGSSPFRMASPFCFRRKRCAGVAAAARCWGRTEAGRDQLHPFSRSPTGQRRPEGAGRGVGANRAALPCGPRR